MRLNQAFSLVLASAASAALSFAQTEVTVYDNTDFANYQGPFMFLPEGIQAGDELQLAPGPRVLTEVSVRMGSSATDTIGDLTLRVYANDGANGQPGTLLHTGVLFGTTHQGGFFLPALVFPVPDIDVPGTITCTLEMTYQTNSGEAGIMSFDPPTIGSSADYTWGRDYPGQQAGWSRVPAPSNTVANLGFSVKTIEGSNPGICASTVPNSTGVAGALTTIGSQSVSDNSMSLAATSLPTQTFGLFIVSQQAGFVQNPGGSQGNLCLGGAIGRYVGPGQIMNSGQSGAVTLLIDLSNTPLPSGSVAIAAGETWNFQYWHRDNVAGTPTSNFTDGIAVTFN